MPPLPQNEPTPARDEAAARLVAQAPIGMAAVSWPDRRFRTANAAYARLTNRGDMVGRTLDELFPDTDLAETLDAMGRAFDTASVTTLRDRPLTVAGEERHVDVVVAPSLDARGRADGVHLTLVDVTERSRAERRAELAEHAAGEADRRLGEAHADLTSFQESLLPALLPGLPTLDLAAAYVASGDRGVAGGDWFDVVVRADGRVALVVGDVVGHGARASAVMGQLRAVLRSQLWSDLGLSEALSALDRFATRTPGAAGTSLCVVELDPETGDLEYCTAGHPPPLVVMSGETGYLEGTGAGLLGSGDRFPTRRAELGPDDLVLLYTDGLLERPGRRPTESTVEVRQAVAALVEETGIAVEAADRAADRVTRTALADLVAATGYHDDVTMLAGHRVSPLDAYRSVLAAEPESVAHVRDDVGDWLEGLGISGPSYLAVQHAVGELVSNAVLHAYAGDASDQHVVDVELTVDAFGVARGTVRDHGRWREPSANADSRGLAMVRGMVEALDVRATEDGTTVTFRHPVFRMAVLVPGREGIGVSAADDAERPFRVELADDGLRLSGPLDLRAAERLREEVLLRAGSGIRIDLTEVSHLGSLGVRVLSEAVAADPAVALVAPYGSVAQHVLDLVRLPYTVPVPNA